MAINVNKCDQSFHRAVQLRESFEDDVCSVHDVPCCDQQRGSSETSAVVRPGSDRGLTTPLVSVHSPGASLKSETKASHSSREFSGAGGAFFFCMSISKFLAEFA